MREYMHGKLSTNDGKVVKIENIVAIHAHPTTELTQL